jgi:hypothetical protein
MREWAGNKKATRPGGLLLLDSLGLDLPIFSVWVF